MRQPDWRAKSTRIVLPGTILLSAFLLFQVQPILGRFMLPRFGGGTEVWTASMLFFELVLVAGYAYGHWLGSRSSMAFQGSVHLCVLGASLLFLRLTPSRTVWSTNTEPAVQIVLLLAATVGIPYATLSATSVLLPRWWSSSFEGSAPYRLYALSNLGSFAALLSYPFAVEPVLRLNTQARLWTGMYVVFTASCGWCAWLVRKQEGADNENGAAATSKRGRSAGVLFWLALAACGSTLMLATTRQMSQEVGVVPFLWVLPLAIYLLTFILCFDRELWYQRPLFAVAAAILAPLAAKIQSSPPSARAWTTRLCVYGLVLFVGCMICHGELARSKPPVRRLTLFYLVISCGGALGGVFAALVAVHLFDWYAEYPLALAATGLLAILGCLRNLRTRRLRIADYGIVTMLAALVFGVAAMSSSPAKIAIAAWRNFYGLVQVHQRLEMNGPQRVLKNGAITHGVQYISAGMRRMPTSYYGPHSGVGVVLDSYAPANRRVGVIGLGAGTVAAYGRDGDVFRFYEINPVIATVAQGWFSFLQDSRAKAEIVLGDARVSLQSEEVRREATIFDILIVDAFTSDAIPIHLLTSECADLYRRRLKGDGVLMLHISNQLLDLQPVARGIAEHLGWKSVLVRTDVGAGVGEDPSDWVIITANPAVLANPAVIQAASRWSENGNPLLWTDDFASLWQVVDRRALRLPWPSWGPFSRR